MSKQSEAKERQQYTPKLAPPICGNCEHMQCKRALPQWMADANRRRPGQYTLNEHGVQSELRCGIGGFSVKKMGSCSEHCFAALKTNP